HTAAPVIAAPVRPRYSMRKKIFLGVAAVFVLMIAFGAWMGIGMYRDSTRPYFAVLTFDVVGDDPTTMNLVEAIAATVNHRLASQGYRVVSPALSAKYRGARKSEAGENLNSRFLIDGTVRKIGDVMRVAVRVDATVSPMTVWSKEFDVDAVDA